MSRPRAWRFAAAPEYQVFPTGPEPLDFYEAVVHATRDTLPLVRELRPEVVVADILTLAPALAAELEGVPLRDADPPRPSAHAHADFPIYSLGARLPRTRARPRAAGGAPASGRARPGARPRELNATRERARPAAARRTSTAASAASSALVATLPAARVPAARGRRRGVHVVGPLMWEPPTADVELPPGDAPLVLVAPSTAQDPEHRLLRAALRGLADAPVRVLATWNRRLPPRPAAGARRTRALVEWVSYARTMPRCDVVVCHAGHGTLVRALASGCAVVACPAVGDMNENAARLDWAGAGCASPRRFVGSRALGGAQRARPCGDGRSMTGRFALPPARSWPASVEEFVHRPRGHRREGLLEKLRGWDSNPQPFG